MGEHPKNQGEGNRQADRAYRKDTEEFVRKGDVDQRAAEAAKDVKNPNQPLSDAEKAGRERAAEFDPKVHDTGKKSK